MILLFLDMWVLELSDCVIVYVLSAEDVDFSDASHMTLHMLSVKRYALLIDLCTLIDSLQQYL